jgi:hypothetical protein
MSHTRASAGTRTLAPTASMTPLRITSVPFVSTTLSPRRCADHDQRGVRQRDFVAATTRPARLRTHAHTRRDRDTSDLSATPMRCRGEFAAALVSRNASLPPALDQPQRYRCRRPWISQPSVGDFCIQ